MANGVVFFLDLNGIVGESVKVGYEEQCEIKSWNWGASHGGTLHTGSGGGQTGLVSGGDISISKNVDVATPDLAQAITTGRIFPSGTITSVKDAGSQNPLAFHVITLSSVKLTSYATGVEGDDITEYLTLHFRGMQIEYRKQANAGSGEGSSTMKYNFATGAQSLTG